MNALDAMRDQPFALLQALDARLRAARLDVAGAPGEIWSGLAFRVRSHWLLAPRSEIREVVPPLPLTRIPGSRDFLLGIANVRGVLEPVTDLGRLLGHAPIEASRGRRLMVLNSRRIPAAFMVDEVLGYRQFVPADQRHGLVEEAGSMVPFLLGAFVREAQVWLVMSLHKLARSELFVQAGA